MPLSAALVPGSFFAAVQLPSAPLGDPATPLLAVAYVSPGGLPELPGERQSGVVSTIEVCSAVASPAARPSGNVRPAWSAATRRLVFDGQLVKWFRQPAKNQDIVLATFENEGWPEHIDDPLPPDADIDVRDRIHNTLSRLNHQDCPLLWFESDGLGSGFCWRLRQPGDGQPRQRQPSERRKR